MCWGLFASQRKAKMKAQKFPVQSPDDWFRKYKWRYQWKSLNRCENCCFRQIRLPETCTVAVKWFSFSFFHGIREQGWLWQSLGKGSTLLNERAIKRIIFYCSEVVHKLYALIHPPKRHREKKKRKMMGNLSKSCIYVKLRSRLKLIVQHFISFSLLLQGLNKI